MPLPASTAMSLNCIVTLHDDHVTFCVQQSSSAASMLLTFSKHFCGVLAKILAIGSETHICNVSLEPDVPAACSQPVLLQAKLGGSAAILLSPALLLYLRATANVQCRQAVLLYSIEHHLHISCCRPIKMDHPLQSLLPFSCSICPPVMPRKLQHCQQCNLCRISFSPHRQLAVSYIFAQMLV